MASELYFLVSYIGILGVMFYKLVSNLREKEIEMSIYDSDKEEENVPQKNEESTILSLREEIKTLKNDIEYLQQLNIKLENEIFKLTYDKRNE